MGSWVGEARTDRLAFAAQFGGLKWREAREMVVRRNAALAAAAGNTPLPQPLEKRHLWAAIFRGPPPKEQIEGGSVAKLSAIVLFGTISLALYGCEQVDSSAIGAKVDSLTTEVFALRTELAQAKTREDFLKSRVLRAEQLINTHAPRTVVEFDPTVSAYQRIDSNMGMFAVSISDVRQFADGVRVTIKLGNLSSTTYRGVKLHLEYGPRSPEGKETEAPDAVAKWLEALQEREEDVAVSLLPGRWNPVQVTLPKLDAKTFGYLSVRIQANVLALQ